MCAILVRSFLQKEFYSFSANPFTNPPDPTPTTTTTTQGNNPITTTTTQPGQTTTKSATTANQRTEGPTIGNISILLLFFFAEHEKKRDVLYITVNFGGQIKNMIRKGRAYSINMFDF